MTLMAACLRLLMIAALAVGFAMPAAAVMPVSGPETHLHALHHVQDTAPVTAPDETCRQHCLGMTVLTMPATAAPYSRRATPIHVAASTVDEPSLCLQPEGHPPRA